MSHLDRVSRREGMKTALAGTATGRFAALDGSTTVLLTTRRRDGGAVATPVHVAWDGERAWFRTWDQAAKLARMWRDPRVEIAPCTVRGRVTGPPVMARARILNGAEAEEARQRLASAFPVVHGALVPFVHRRRGWTTVHLELAPR